MAKDSPKKASKKRAAPVAPPSPVASSSTASSASPSPSRASSSSASPEPEVAEVAKEKNKKKDAKGAAKFVAPRRRKGEEELMRMSRKDRKYKPPQGFYPITDTTGTSSADWATINADPDLELWAVRVPEGVRPFLSPSPHPSHLFAQIKPRHLDGLTIQLPPTESDGPIATFNAKKVPYDLFMHPADNPSREKRRKLTTETACTGSEEMLSFVALLPKKAAGGDHLYEGACPSLSLLTPLTTLAQLPDPSCITLRSNVPSPRQSSPTSPPPLRPSSPPSPPPSPAPSSPRPSCSTRKPSARNGS